MLDSRVKNYTQAFVEKHVGQILDYRALFGIAFKVQTTKEEDMIKGKGQLAHHFWGTYYATIGIWFDSEEDAKHSLNVLGPLWKVSPRVSSAIIFHGKDPELNQVLETLEKFGANKRVVTSCTKSIDYGEPFEIELPKTI